MKLVLAVIYIGLILKSPLPNILEAFTTQMIEIRNLACITRHKLVLELDGIRKNLINYICFLTHATLHHLLLLYSDSSGSQKPNVIPLENLFKKGLP